MHFKEFGSLFKFLPKSVFKASAGRELGQYPFFTSSNTQKKWIDIPTYETEGLIFGTGGSASVHHIKGGFSTSTDCLVAEPVEAALVCSRYCFHYLIAHIGLLEAGFRGAGLKHIAKGYIQSIKVPLPPIYEQRRIAAILDQADALRAKRREALAQLDSLAQSVFIEMFGDPTNNHYRVKCVHLSEVTSRITDGTHLTPKFINAGVPFIFVKNFNNGQIDFQTDKFISEEEHAALYKRCPVEQGDVLYTTVGATYGQAVAIGTFTKFAFQRHVAHLKPDAKKIHPGFLGIVMQLPFVKRQADRWARGAAQPTINLTELRQFEIPLPTLTMQREFAKQVTAVDKLKSAHRTSLTELDTLFASLQHRAFRGEL